MTLEPYGDVNTLDLPEETNSYLILRSCVLTGTGSKTTTISVNGQDTVEMYSCRLLNGPCPFLKKPISAWKWRTACWTMNQKSLVPSLWKGPGRPSLITLRSGDGQQL